MYPQRERTRDLTEKVFRAIPQPQAIKVNTGIRSATLRVIDEEGKNLGVISREEALALADPARGIDLIEISPNAKPPVARLMNFDKYRYEVEKAKKKERQSQKASEMKQVQISARAAMHDLETRLNKLVEFLDEGRPVEIQLKLRGREKGNRKWAEQKLREFLAMIPGEYKELYPPRFGGRGMIVQIARKH